MCDNSNECASSVARGFSNPAAARRPLDDVPDATPGGPAPASVRPGWTQEPEAPLVVAVPCELSGGLDAERSLHFGRAPGFAIAALKGGYIAKETFVTNRPHDEGGDHGFAANALLNMGVTDVVTAAIGTGMYRRLVSGGVRVWREQDAPTVSSAIDAFMAGEAAPFFEGDAHPGGHR